MQVAVFQPACPAERDAKLGWTPEDYTLCRRLVAKDSSPGFKVTIDHPFYIGKFEITQSEFSRVMGRNPAMFQGGKVADDAGRHPVEQVSWNNAQAFVRKLNQLEKTNAYRLPTEFEWEYAGRAGGRGQVDWDVIRRQAVQGLRATSEFGKPTTRRVGSKEPNAWGLYDMLGNVWEWVQDFYNEKTFPDPAPPSRGKEHVLKGAGFLSDVKNAIYATHGAGPADGWDVGFRIVKDIDKEIDPPAQERAPESASPGQTIFAANCAFCHGAGARGGPRGGPDLASSPIVRGDVDGKQLSSFLKAGRPEKGMPAFQLTEARVRALAAFLHSIVADSATQPSLGREILVGNAASGKVFFEGSGGCTQCHSVEGDLKGIGAKYPPMVLQGRLVLPRGQGGYPGFEPPETPTVRVTISEPDGRTQSGLLLFLSDYYVTFVDSEGRRHTLPRSGDVPKVQVQDPLEAHLKLQDRLTDRQMHDLTAYLSSLK